MVDIRTILLGHRPKKNEKKNLGTEGSIRPQLATTSEIPDVFFDEILVSYKLGRIDIILLMYLYRKVWCRPNLYKEYGISQILGHKEVAQKLQISLDEFFQSLHKLEQNGFVGIIRSGQYFVRKYFTKKNDEKFGQTYDDFD